MSERVACRVLGQHRSTQRKVPQGRPDEEALTADIVALASQYGRYGYRRITALLREAGWVVNVKRVERIWRREGLKVPQKQPKKRRLWLNDGSCVRLRPERPNHVWSYDFVESRTHDGRKFRMLNVLDEFTRECLSIRIARKLNSTDVIDVLSELFILRGVPGHIRSDNGPEFIATAVRTWIAAVGARTAFIEPGSPWDCRGSENGPGDRFPEAGLLRELQFQAPRRAVERRDLLQPGRGPDRDRVLAPTLQHKAPALIARLPSSGTTGGAVAGFATRTRYAGHPKRGAKTCHALRLKPDHSMGAGQAA